MRTPGQRRFGPLRSPTTAAPNRRVASVAVAAAAGAGLIGCAGALETPTQSVAVETSPPGASCSLSLGGRPVAQVARTPASIEVPLSIEPLTVSCTRSGYLPAVYTARSVNPPVEGAEDVIGGLLALATEGEFFAKRGYETIAVIELERDPALPATFDDLKPVEPVSVQTSTVPLAQ